MTISNIYVGAKCLVAKIFIESKNTTAFRNVSDSSTTICVLLAQPRRELHSSKGEWCSKVQKLGRRKNRTSFFLRFQPLRMKYAAIHYRCVNRRFSLSAHNCQVPTPTSQNLEVEQQIRIFLSKPTHQLLGRLKSTIPNLQIYLPKKANSEKFGLVIDNQCRTAFLSLRMNKCLERVNYRQF